MIDSVVEFSVLIDFLTAVPLYFWQRGIEVSSYNSGFIYFSLQFCQLLFQVDTHWRLLCLCGELTPWSFCNPIYGLPRWLSGKVCLPMQELQECGFNPWIEKIPLEEEIATHSSILAGIIPWTEEPGRLQSGGRKESWLYACMHSPFYIPHNFLCF